MHTDSLASGALYWPEEPAITNIKGMRTILLAVTRPSEVIEGQQNPMDIGGFHPDTRGGTPIRCCCCHWSGVYCRLIVADALSHATMDRGTHIRSPSSPYLRNHRIARRCDPADAPMPCAGSSSSPTTGPFILHEPHPCACTCTPATLVPTSNRFSTSRAQWVSLDGR